MPPLVTQFRTNVEQSLMEVRQALQRIKVALSEADAPQIKYSPTTSTDWATAPTDVEQAIDSLAAYAQGEIHVSMMDVGEVATASPTDVTTLTGAATLTSTYEVYLCDGTFTVTLPSSPNADRTFTVKNVGAGTVTVDGDGNNIDGAGTKALAQYEAIQVYGDGSQWWMTSTS